MKFPNDKSLPIPYGWYFIYFSDELAVGDIKTLFYFNRDMVLFRTSTGELGLSEAFCPHLGAHLGVGGSIVENTIRCPFHGWRFDNKGYCVDVPYASKIPPRAQGKACLKTYPVVEVNGMIWAWYHPQDIQPLFDVHSLPEMESGEWMPYQKFKWTINSCIQEAGENAVDTAHFIYVHKLPEIDAKPVITYDGHRRSSELVLALDKFNSDGQKSGHIESRVLTACCGPGQTWTRSFGMTDFLIIGLPTPVTDNKMELHFACSLPKAKEKSNAALAHAVIQNASDQVEQDIPIWENKIYRNDPILCDGDGPIAQYRKWFNQFYVPIER